MTSILTNNGAMVALQTLSSVNKNLEMTQSEISTGKRIPTAKENASVWAIAATMQSDVSGFQGISDTLAVGSATVAVARQASETVTELLTEIKEKVVSAQDPAQDTVKLQADADQLIGQIRSVVGAAQFNGVNLVNGGASINVLSSIDRDGTGAVTPSTIAVTAQDLTSDAAAGVIGAFADGGGTTSFTVGGNADDAAVAISDTGDAAFTLQAGTLSAGDRLTITIDDQNFSYQVTADDTAATTPEDVVALALKSLVDNANISGLTVDYDSGTVGTLVFQNATGDDVNVTARAELAGAGGLADLNGFSVTGGTAVADIESMITTAIDASAAFGSSQGRIETQMDFVNKLSDSLKSGIGALVDANMEEASARLQALQVQQQLGIQSLSIANQQPNNVLSLFR